MDLVVGRPLRPLQVGGDQRLAESRLVLGRARQDVTAALNLYHFFERLSRSFRSDFGQERHRFDRQILALACPSDQFEGSFAEQNDQLLVSGRFPGGGEHLTGEFQIILFGDRASGVPDPFGKEALEQILCLIGPEKGRRR